MRLSPLPLALLALSLPAPALAFPAYGQSSYGQPYYDYPQPGPGRMPVSPYGSYAPPLATAPPPYNPPPVRSCNRGSVLTGAAIGGGLGALLANNSRSRRWSLPMGAAMGGILGGLVSGC